MAVIKQFSVDIVTRVATVLVSTETGTGQVQAWLPFGNAELEQSLLAAAKELQAPGAFLIYANGAIYEREPSPGAGYTWDWPSSSWVFSQDLHDSTLTEVTSQALAAIDNAAGLTRLKYITSVPGQAETYQRKEEQARAWKLENYQLPAPSFIAAEAAALNQDPVAIADQVIALADYWSLVKGPQIEAIRRKWKVAIEAAGQDIEAINAAKDAGVAELNTL
jgi:hypothetical protein